MLKTSIEDGHGKGNTLKIGEEGEVFTVVHPHPPKDEALSILPLRSYLTLNNDGTTIDMRVNGSVTNQIFSINANSDGNKRDKFIAAINIVISDAGASLSKFGNLSALTNGCELRWVTDDLGTVVIADSLKTNFEFIRLAGGKPAFGDAATAFQAANVVGTSEAYFVQLDFDEIFCIPWGFRLRHGSNDRIELIIKDDVTGIDQFDAIAYGSEF